jgi:TatD DNase family protein
MLETDGPYMSPEPFRGQRSESSHVKIIAETIAKIHDTSLDDVANITTQNAKRLFKLPIT